MERLFLRTASFTWGTSPKPMRMAPGQQALLFVMLMRVCMRLLASHRGSGASHRNPVGEIRAHAFVGFRGDQGWIEPQTRWEILVMRFLDRGRALGRRLIADLEGFISRTVAEFGAVPQIGGLAYTYLKRRLTVLTSLGLLTIALPSIVFARWSVAGATAALARSNGQRRN